ncbi:hypothetical protein [Clostridium lacusfryxellense]|uniref:hypothetical protein n=1 Tax=Clostridium lacusfryxellense TaxID=205328 RepID=UPI001C0D5245|nr:hypothetical protein [Clostridium lacusfryxellense]MBU3113245.1 hypothetical protein [Clostridium lacusfryxellense]
MKKRFVLIAIVVLVLSTISYPSKAMTNQKNNFKKEKIENVVPIKLIKDNTVQSRNFEDYIKLIGLSKKQLIDTIGEKPTTVDEGGLEFFKYGIRVWFEGYGTGPVQQVYTDKKNVDFRGVKIGDKISDFKKIFGKTVQQNTTSAYSNFEYNGIILSVYYNPKTKITFAVYILDQVAK